MPESPLVLSPRSSARHTHRSWRRDLEPSLANKENIEPAAYIDLTLEEDMEGDSMKRRKRRYLEYTKSIPGEHGGKRGMRKLQP